ncbi:MAG: acetylglutamate kinase [Clostridiales bacterium]|nr:acetylglutamate kinase [Clostridiales bacterium]
MIKVIKIGGNVIDDETKLDAFLLDFAKVDGPKILVHGGGKIATRMAERLGVETCMVQGRRVTSKPMLDIAVMVYAGLLNKRIVARLQAIGVNSIGLCGADAGCITSQRREASPVDYGEVGDVTGVNASSLMSLINASMTPVICAITADTQGNLLNTNADTVATETAKALSALSETRLTFCFEKNGVLKNIDDPTSVIRHINPYNIASLIADGTVSAGMIPKINNALEAVTQSPIESVIIKNSDNLNDDSGTIVSRS